LIPLRPAARRGADPIVGHAPLCEEIAVLSFFRRLLKCEQGATALEYTLIACLTGLVVLQVLQLPGSPTM
jgi:hypothetical protein